MRYTITKLKLHEHFKTYRRVSFRSRSPSDRNDIKKTEQMFAIIVEQFTTCNIAITTIFPKPGGEPLIYIYITWIAHPYIHTWIIYMDCSEKLVPPRASWYSRYSVSCVLGYTVLTLSVSLRFLLLSSEVRILHHNRLSVINKLCSHCLFPVVNMF